MALYKTADVTLALDILRIWSADDRWGGVEPYVVPVFFKVDGERYLARLTILDTDRPREGSGEVWGEEIELSVDTVADHTSPLDDPPTLHEDNPYIWVPPGSLLGRGSFGSGGQVIMRDVSFTRKLIPIPFRIDVMGEYGSAADALDLLLSFEEEVGDWLIRITAGLNGLIADLFGLDEELESCPDLDLGASDFVSTIDAQFRALIPGTIGGVFVCMENDAFDESMAQALRRSVKDEITHVINHTINGINRKKIRPDPERITNEIDFSDNVGADLLWRLLIDWGVSLGALVAGAITWNAPLAIYGILTGLSWLAGGLDDNIGFAAVTFDHSKLGPAGSLILQSQKLGPQDEGDNNHWELQYTLTVNSIEP